MKKYTDLFFDFDDTLYDTHRNSEEALKDVFSLYQLDRYIAEYQIFHKTYWENNVRLWDLYAQQKITLTQLGIDRFKNPLSTLSGNKDNFPKDEFFLEINSKFLEICSHKTAVIENAKELLIYLRDKGYKLHLCSNGPHDIQYKKLTSSGLKDFFETINLSEDIGYNKPSIHFFEYVINKIGASLKNILMIGDNYNTDVEGGMKAGLDTVFFNQANPDFIPPQPPTYTVSALKEITNFV